MIGAHLLALDDALPSILRFFFFAFLSILSRLLYSYMLYIKLRYHSPLSLGGNVLQLPLPGFLTSLNAYSYSSLLLGSSVETFLEQSAVSTVARDGSEPGARAHTKPALVICKSECKRLHGCCWKSKLREL